MEKIKVQQDWSINKEFREVISEKTVLGVKIWVIKQIHQDKDWQSVNMEKDQKTQNSFSQKPAF